ncbi:hypothetical protein LY71_105230 [Geodermatophilus tzadiensis]|uniref:Uncharacterized protein n=1 Tax=Geodermatophilus tzadiensis TaxID=1137988 RepID=A0A2T0TVV5_9ACTN|nr:hypothetical protein [Geodermatophilus tzadiensis]PRY49785.1 hypothetical protein LY71_105230 [Geodermatophilus tzadiensis]
MYRSALVSSLLTTAVLLTGCEGEDDTATAARDRPAVSSQPAGTTRSAPDAPTTTAAPSTPAPATVAPTTPAPTTTARPTTARPTAPAPTTPAPTPSPAPAPDGSVLPDEAVPVHGGQVWAVYLAVGDPDDEWGRHMLAETADYVHASFGYTGSGVGEVACDVGAAEQLGFDPQDHRVAVYFDSAARAQEFVAVYDRQDVGSASVTTYCLD